MKVINKGAVENQQNIDSGATGYFFANGKGDISESEKMGVLRSIIEENCTQREREAFLPVISELCQSIGDGKKEVSNVSIWIDRLYKAAASLGSIATFSNAAWWPTLIEGISNLIQGL